MVMRSVMLAAVHYGELPTSPAQEVVDELSNAGLVQEFIEVTDQPELAERPDISELISWRQSQRQLEHRWREYVQTSNPFKDMASAINERLFRFRLHLSSEFRRKQWRNRQVERFVAAKHIRAWQQVSQSQCSALVVVESDATLSVDSVSRMASVLATLTSEEPTYVNLAGGLNREDILIDHLVAHCENGLALFSRPVTNTSCAYAVNRTLVNALLGFLARSPNSRTLGIDWVFNAFFLDEASATHPIQCLHAEPPALQHGSLTGVTQSWHPDR